MSFTPGPWKVRMAQVDLRPYIYANGVLIAKTYRTTMDGGLTQEIGEANARLIVAAPEMLAALEEAQGTLTEYIEDAYCGKHLGRGLCDCKPDIVARIENLIRRIKETPNA